jgi:hypothetical protein
MRVYAFAALGCANALVRTTFDPLGLAARDGSSLSRFSPATLPSTLAQQPRRETAAIVAAAATAATFLPDAAMAKGGEYGLAEGRIISLAHPVAMGGCFLATLYAGYTGLQWRQLRELGVELKGARSAAKDAEAKLEAHAGSDAASDVPPPQALVQAAAATKAVVTSITEKRTQIQAGNFRDRHYQLGTILLGFGIPMALEGPVNTYMRAGKLFPGEHVYAGVGVVALWAFAASLVPEMQKGKEWARYGHMGANALTFGLFAYYQIPTGLGIAAKVIEKTKFP